MKRKVKVLTILLCTITLIIGSSITAFAEDTYNYEITYKRTDQTYSRLAVVSSCYSNCAMVLLSNGRYTFCYMKDNTVKECSVVDGSCDGFISYQVDSDGTVNYNYYSSGSVFNVSKDVLDGSFSGISVYESEADYLASFSEEPETEESTTEPTTEESSEEPTTPTTPSTPGTSDTNNGIAGDLVYDLIGDTTEFTPQSVMAIFVVCLALECLSHIASALLSVGGMK